MSHTASTSHIALQLLDRLNHGKYFLKHLALAGNRHHIHSPFVYRLFEQVIDLASLKNGCLPLEAERTRLLTDTRSINLKDFGAGSQVSAKKTRTVASIARSALMPPYWAGLLGKLANYVKAQRILELGTSFGLTTAYLAQSGAQVVTLEGCLETAVVARKTFDHLALKNVHLIEGNLKQTLQVSLQQGPFDMVIIDANHSAKGMATAYETVKPHLSGNALVVFDDIYWSRETSIFWTSFVSTHRECQIIDLFRQGWVFHMPSQRGEYFRLRTPVLW